MCKFINWNKYQKGSFAEFLKTVTGHIIVFGMEGIVLIFEFFGGRAENLQFDFSTAVFEMMSDLKVVVKQVNIKFVILVLIFIIISYVIEKRIRKIMTFLWYPESLHVFIWLCYLRESENIK